MQIKADVETQGDFVKSLATEVRGAQYTQIEDVVAFVTWLDEELSFLVSDSPFAAIGEDKCCVVVEAGDEYLLYESRQWGKCQSGRGHWPCSRQYW